MSYYPGFIFKECQLQNMVTGIPHFRQRKGVEREREKN